MRKNTHTTATMTLMVVTALLAASCSGADPRGRVGPADKAGLQAARAWAVISSTA